MENGASGRFARAGPSLTFLRFCILTSTLLQGTPALLLPSLCAPSGRLVSLALRRGVAFARSRVSTLSRFSRICWSFAAVSPSDQLRHLATQVDSSASLEDTVAQGILSLLVTAPEPSAPAHVQSSARLPSRSRSRSLVPKLSDGGSPTGLALKCCRLAPLERTRLSLRPACLCPVLQESTNLCAVRPPVCTRPLVRIHLAPLRIDGAAVTNAAEAHANRQSAPGEI